MANAAKVLFLIAALAGVHAAQAADQASGTGPDASARSEPDPMPPEPNGAELFRTHCAMCHQPAELAGGLRSAADPEAARAGMARFLARHGRSDAAADEAIIGYLATSTFR
jgi:mono/diheme cytochrome c family protein